MPLQLRCFQRNGSERRKSKDIDKTIGLGMKDYKKFIKLLLLGLFFWVYLIWILIFFVLPLTGTSDSGKTTISKHIKILYGQGFTELERQSMSFETRINVFEAIKVIIIIEKQSYYFLTLLICFSYTLWTGDSSQHE